jgi:transposase InsO family protein
MGSTAAKKKAKIGFDYIHSIVDDHTHLAYSKIHDNEKGETCAGFFERAKEFYKGHGITIERVNRTVQTEWAYRQVYETNAARSAVLPDFLHRYNHQRRHHGLKNHPPISRLSPTS